MAQKNSNLTLGELLMHGCDAAYIDCEDYRLHQRKDGRNYTADHIRSLNIDCDLITRAGGVQDLLRQGATGSADSVIRDIHVAHALHHAYMVLFKNHEDCGAYKGFKFPNRDMEIARHKRDLSRTLSMIHLLFPKKWLIGFFAELVPGTTDVFTIGKVIECKPNRIIRV